MADFNKIFDNIKDQVGAEAQTDLKEFSDQGKQDAQAFLDQSRERLEKWMQLLADKQIDEDEFGWLVESQKAAAQMAALQKANAGNMQIEQFRDSVFQIIVKTAVPALIAAAA
jgi:transcriptional regulator with PAS, ATPase and Fis domain